MHFPILCYEKALKFLGRGPLGPVARNAFSYRIHVGNFWCVVYLKNI